MKEIKGFPDYKINKSGDVWSFKFGKKRKLKTGKGSSGYLSTQLWKNNNAYMKTVHRLVAETFIPNPENKPEVNHKNGIKTDNRIENLEWMTSSENSKHSFATGLQVHPKGNAKLNDYQVRVIHQLLKFKILMQREIGKIFGVSQGQISSIKSNKQWKDV